jgi:tetratricopeptide (TPR) repeat protein
VKTEAKAEEFPEIVTAGQDLQKTLDKDLENLETSLEKAKGIWGEKEKWMRIFYLVVGIGLAAFVAVWVIGSGEKLTPGSNEEATPRSSVTSVKKPAHAKSALSEGPHKGANPMAAAKAFLNEAAENVDKNPEKAKSLLLKAIKLDPKNAQAHFQLGLTCMALKNSPGAIIAYQKSIQLDPNFPEAYFNLGYIYGMDKNYSQAEKNYDQVVKMAPPYLDEALFNLAFVQEKQGKRKESTENLERALQVNPKNERAQRFLNKLRVNS